MHNHGLAVDFIIVSDDGTRALWTEEEKWTRVPAIAKSLGFVWGILNRSGIFRIFEWVMEIHGCSIGVSDE
ncbi:hypothetical protein [Peribacillus simplex]|uniref:hypothetical protein n=1 Tax=Peribacillus simplex TaxID=1478 RepID=UPI0016231D90